MVRTPLVIFPSLDENLSLIKTDFDAQVIRQLEYIVGVHIAFVVLIILIKT